MRSSPHIWFVAAALFTVATTPAALSAQSAEVRAQLERWDDSLAARKDPVELRALRTTALAAADQSRGESIAVLRLAMVEFRLAQLTADGALFGEAARALQGVHEDHPTWPVAASLYAAAQLREERLVGSFGYTMRAMLGLDPAAPLVAAFVAGTGPDGDYDRGLRQLASWASSGRDPVVLEVALRSLRAAPPPVVRAHPEIALWRSRIERLVGDPDSALTAIEAAAAIHPNDPMILRSQALLRFVYGRGDGAAPWYRGLELADGAALSTYLHDLELVVPDSILTTLRTLPGGPARATTMRAFWNSQDRDGLPSGLERLTEHYRRRDFAWTHYVKKSVRDSLEQIGSRVWTDTLSLSALDARGRIMLLHGTPISRTSIGGGDGPEVERTLGIVGMPTNESWRYHDSRQGDLLFHFYVPDGQKDFIASESIVDILAATSQYARFRRDESPPLSSDGTRNTVKTYGAELVSEVAQALLRSRLGSSPIYEEMLNAGKNGADSLQALERKIGRAALAAPSSYELGFELDLHAAVDILALGSTSRGPVVQVAFAIPAAGLTPQRLRTGVVYPVRMRIALLDSAGRIVTQVDTTRGYVTRTPLRPGQYLLGQVPLTVAPGSYRARATVESGRSGTLTASTPVTVADPRSTRPTLSDPAIGQRSAGIVWNGAPSDTAWTDPRHDFARDREMQLYFEAAGIPASSSFTVDLTIGRVGGGVVPCPAPDSRLTIQFQQESNGGVNRFQRGISLGRLETGSYLLGVTITAADGQTATRCRTFRVVK